ncbi:SseB family protein [Streptomyces flavidovirens]|uniref:SseB family protein n=1 Tax=Streptomyces flavidovirens TaxID=67298 RepID=UPI00055D6A4D|nr:SseB family protein [Streptomyces flavidovirens]
MRGEALALRLTELAGTGEGDLRSLVGEFRRSEVLVPVVDGALLSVATGPVRWLFAFTSMETLESFAGQRGEVIDEWVPVFGARLVDQVIPDIGGLVGVAVDVAGAAPMMLPPVRGIVPDVVALDGVGAAV